MVTVKEGSYRKREYILIKHGLRYYYARLYDVNDNMYHIMAMVGEKEGRTIVDRANETSETNKEIDRAFEIALSPIPEGAISTGKTGAKKSRAKKQTVAE